MSTAGCFFVLGRGETGDRRETSGQSLRLPSIARAEGQNNILYTGAPCRSEEHKTHGDVRAKDRRKQTDLNHLVVGLA